jgi:hypothetical protein
MCWLWDSLLKRCPWDARFKTCATELIRLTAQLGDGLVVETHGWGYVLVISSLLKIWENHCLDKGV